MSAQKFKIAALSYCTAEKIRSWSRCIIWTSISLLLLLGFVDYNELGYSLSAQSAMDGSLPALLNPWTDIPDDTNAQTYWSKRTGAANFSDKNTSIRDIVLGPVVTKPVWQYWPGHQRNRKVMGANRDSLKRQIKRAIDYGCMKGWNHKRRPIWVQMGDFPKKKKDIIVWYQLEQEGSKYSQIKEFHKAMHDADAIWDFSKANIRLFGKKHGVRPSWEGGRYFYVPLWNTVPDRYFKFTPNVNSRKKYDILLFGSMNERRQMICNELKRRKFRIYCGSSWGKDLEQKKLSSRLLLNVHFYPNGSLEVHRLDSVLAVGMVVVSEFGSDEFLNREYSSVVNFNSYDNLVETVVAKLEKPESELILERKANIKFMRDVYERVDFDLCLALNWLVKRADKKFPKDLY